MHQFLVELFREISKEYLEIPRGTFDGFSAATSEGVSKRTSVKIQEKILGDAKRWPWNGSQREPFNQEPWSYRNTKFKGGRLSSSGSVQPELLLNR